MAIDKAVNPLGNPSEVDIEIINPDAVIIREDDDGFLAILGPELSEQIMPDFDANLAEHMDERELNGLGFELLDDFESDSRSRQDWEDTYKKGLDLLGLKIEDRSSLSSPLLNDSSVNNLLLFGMLPRKHFSKPPKLV